MKNLKFLFVVLATAMLVACGGEKKKSAEVAEPVNPRIDQSMVHSNIDEEELTYLATQYLDFLKAKDFESALAMLKSFDGKTVTALTEAQKNSLKRVYNAYPVFGYTIDDIVFYSETDTEIKYTIILFEKQYDDELPNTVKSILTPKRIDGAWSLCVDNRSVGEKL